MSETLARALADVLHERCATIEDGRLDVVDRIEAAEVAVEWCLTKASQQLAKAVLTMAADGGMPDSFWESDSRITAARSVLGIAEAWEAQNWAENHEWTDEVPK